MIRNLARGVQAFTSNAFLVVGERTVLVDTGSNFPVVDKLGSHLDELDAVILTHTHPDHVGNLDALRDACGVETWGYDTDDDAVDHAIADEEPIEMGDHEYVAYHTPGHKDDHLCFYAPEPKVLFAGDLIFQNGSFGRTDLPEGDRKTLIESIERIEEAVDEDLRELHCGHGRSVTDDPYLDIELAGQAASMY